MSATSLSAAALRPVHLRRRPDLSVSPLPASDGARWVVKDPLTLNYILLRDEEYAVLELLDGQTSLDQIKQRFEQKFLPLRLTPQRLQEFLAKLNRENLLVVEADGQGEQLLQRRTERRRRDRLSRWTNVLAIQFRGVNPERFLNWLYPQIRWLYTWPVICVCLLTVIAAAVLLTVEFGSLWQQIQDLPASLTPQSVFWLAATLATAKVLHELGHALTCKHFGGSCHELGLLLLVFTPCLYCNVSDAWSFPNRWHRIAVSAAGIFVEIVLAAACGLLWWFSQPGLFHNLCLNMIVVCSVSSLLLNGNPLLRYDGYYVLSDLLGVPNLKEQSTQLVHQYLGRWLLGVELVPDSRLPVRRRGLLVTYWLASTAYRWFILIAILWMVNLVAKQYNLELVARTLTWFVLLSIVGLGGWKFVQQLHRHARDIRRFRAALLLGVLCALAAGVLLLPLPRRVEVPVVAQPCDVQTVFVTVPGRLQESVRLGDTVTRGQQLARLANVELELDVQALVGQCDLQAHHLRNLELRQGRDATAAAETGTAKEVLADIEQRLAEKQANLERLTVTAPMAGVVLPAAYRPRDAQTDGSLNGWYGHPLENRNQGAFLDVGAILCRIGNPQEMEALLEIDETNVQHVAVGQRVSMLFDESGGSVLMGTVREISRSDTNRRRHEELDSTVASPEKGKPPTRLYSAYWARVVLDDQTDRLLADTGGRAKIHVEPRSLGWKLYDHFSRTFRFRL